MQETDWVSQRLPQMKVPVSLRRLFPQASFVGCADIRVVDVTERSSECAPGMLFAALPGTKTDGSRYAVQAIERGARSLLVAQPLPGISVPQCVVPNVRRAYAELCAAVAGYPSRKLGLAAVTGTNGKTTTTWLIRSILRAAGKRTGLLGTIEYSDGYSAQRAGMTTPDSRTLSSWLGAMVALRATHAAIELSSHALDQDRAAGTQLDVAIVTNVTQDHFDYHKNFKAYLASKARILGHCKRGGLAVLNADDPGSISLRPRVDGSLRLQTFGLEQPADVTGTIIRESLAGTRFVLTAGSESIEICTSLIGRHNVSNCLAATAAALHFGLPLDVIASGIEALASVPGRLERIDGGQPCQVFVDYAHTEDALRRCVAFLRRLTRGRVICVFGAGGDRDRSKRPLLGKAAMEADLAVVTSDNPRSEPPDEIIRDILAGFEASTRDPYVEPDRAEAIRWALERANPEDTVLIAGKGHETEQIIGQEIVPFDDREVVRQCLMESSHARRMPEKLPA